MKSEKINMNRAERELFAIFVAELMGNKVLLDEIYPELQGTAVGRDDKNGVILYDESKKDPSVIRENVLESTGDKKRKRR